MKFRDSNIREHTNLTTHPFFEPYMIFNDDKKSVSFYLESKYEDDQYCLKHWQVIPREMAKKHGALAPDFVQKNPYYHWPEKPENKVIKVKKGATVRVPHGFYVAQTIDGKPATYRVRMLEQL